MRASRLIPTVAAALAAAALLAFGLRERPAPAPGAPLVADEPGPARGDEPPALSAGGDPGRPSGDGAAGDAQRAQGDGRAAATLTGRVVDESGRGLAGARVVLGEVDPESLRGAPYPDRAVLGETQTDREGAFAFTAPAGSWLRVTASAAGRATVARRVASSGARVLLVLPPAGALAVQVLDAAGAPAADVPVHAQGGETPWDATTGADGRAVLEDLAPGAVRLRVGGGASPAVTVGPYAVRAGETQEVLVLLPRAVRLAGVVIDDADERPLAGARVVVSHPGASRAAEPTGADGRFGPVEGGGVGERVFLAVTVDGHAPLLEPVVLRAESVQQVELRVVAAEPWRGVVRHADGRPAVGAEVAYTPDGVAGRAPAAALSDALGRFELPPPPPPAPGRRVVLTARLGPELAALALRPDTLRPTEIVLTLAAGTQVTGRVRDAAGAPLPGVGVRLVPDWAQVPRAVEPDPAASRLLAVNELGFDGLAAASDADGTWRVAAVPAGPYRVLFGQEGAQTPRAQVLQVAGPHVDAGEQVLGGGLVLEGRVRDADGAPLEGVAVRVAPEGAPDATRTALTDAAGDFVVSGLVAGPHEVLATWPGRERLRGRVDVDAERGARIELAFDPAARLRVELLREGTPWRGVLTLALRGDDGREPPRATRHVRVGDGAADVEGLPLGTWTVEAFSPDGLRAAAGPVQLAAGRASEVRLDLRPGAVLRGTVREPGGGFVAGAEVVLQAADTGRRWLASSGVGGAWRFEDLLPGRYLLRVHGRGGAPGEDALELAAGEDREQPLWLLPGGHLDVRVLDERGRPVAGALLLFRNETGVLRGRGPQRTDAHGEARREDLPPGEVGVRARAPDGRSVEGHAVVATGGEAPALVLRLAPAER